MTSAWQLWLLWGFAGRYRHRLAGPGLRRDRRQPLVRAAPRRRDRGVLGRELDRSAGLPARDRPPGRRARAGAGRPAWSRSSRCCSCRWCWWSCATAPPTSAPRRTAPPADYVEPPVDRRRPAGRDRLALATLREASAPLDVLGAVPDVLDLRLVDQRPDRHPLHPGRARPRHARTDRGRPARADRRLRHRRHGRLAAG